MSETVFGAEYARAYDILYQDKDYAAECDLVERIFRENACSPVARVLDLGCGTGGHGALLAARGYTVVGVDRSEDMLRLARARGSSARFERGDLTSVDLHETFDATIVMFGVLSYVTSNADIYASLSSARRHLEPAGLLVFDAWYGPAVLAQRPSERVKVFESSGGGRVIRVASSQLDTRRNVCTVDYRLWRLHEERLVGETHEQHAMRYFFEPELESLLARAGFDPVRVGAFPNIDEPPSEETWNVLFVARAR